MIAAGVEIKTTNAERCAAYRKKYPERVRESYRKWRIKNREKVLAYLSRYNKLNRKKIAARDKNRYKTEPLFRLKKNLRCRILVGMKRRGWYKNNTTKKILGADVNTVKTWIENKFSEGMSWQNQGKWHIDHIVPVSSAKTKEEIEKLFHYKNLQPLWAEDNWRKGKWISG